MATEAQKLIGLSLAKIAQSRMNRGGISLHKNLLVATVLQKARFIFMEEAYGVAFVQAATAVPAPVELPVPVQEKEREMPVEVPSERRMCKRRRESTETIVDSESSSKRVCDEVSEVSEERVREEPSRVCSDSSSSDDSESSSDSDECDSEPMEVDRITSLVSVFTFGASTEEPLSLSRLNRTVSTPDLCSAQAKELDSLAQRTALPMTVS